jgi:hypothetical protein
MRWLDDVSTDLRKMGINEWRDSKGSRVLEAYCKGGQGPHRAVAPSKKKKRKKKKNHVIIFTQSKLRVQRLRQRAEMIIK